MTVLRECPNCSKRLISVGELFFSHIVCPNCKSTIGVHWFASTAASIVILIVTLLSSFAVLMQMGFYAAILWFPFPIGSLNYLKVRLFPLETKRSATKPLGSR